LLARALLPVGSARIWAGVQLDEGRDQGKPALDSSVTRASYPLEDSARFTVGADLGGGLGFTAFEIRAFYGTYHLITDRVRRPTSAVTRRISESDIDAKDASLRLTALRPLGNGTLRVGFDGKTRFDLNAIGRFTDFDSAGRQTGILTEVSVDNARRTNLGLFAETEQVLIAGRLNASLGLRGDSVKTRNNGGFFGDRETSNGAFSGFLALTVFPATRWSVTAQYSRGFRDPLLSDRYFRGVSGRGFVIGNPDISPERSNQWDLAVRTSVGPVNLAAYGYLYRIVNLIERYQQGTNFYFRNRGEEEIYGAELEGDVSLHGGFTLRLGVSTCRGRILDDGSFAADIPPETATLSIDHRVNHRIWWSLSALLVARDEAPGPTEKVSPGWGTVDLSAGYRFPFGVDFRVIARNLFDKKYPQSSDAVAVNAPGRGVSVVLGGSF
ncbi:MAG: TonB-dependent receptor, partial [Thermoanaerobaculia bacterium]